MEQNGRFCNFFTNLITVWNTLFCKSYKTSKGQKILFVFSVWKPCNHSFSSNCKKCTENRLIGKNVNFEKILFQSITVQKRAKYQMKDAFLSFRL